MLLLLLLLIKLCVYQLFLNISIVALFLISFLCLEGRYEFFGASPELGIVIATTVTTTLQCFQAFRYSIYSYVLLTPFDTEGLKLLLFCRDITHVVVVVLLKIVACPNIA